MTTTYKTTIFLLSLLAGILSLTSCKDAPAGDTQVLNMAKASLSNKRSIDKDRNITIYYFHTTYRCYSCTKIEKLTKGVLNNQFKKQLESGKIVYKAINIEKKKNKHYIKDYKLFTKSIILVDVIKGKQVKWKNLDKMWNYLRDQSVFQNYIKDELTAFIKGSS